MKTNPVQDIAIACAEAFIPVFPAMIHAGFKSYHQKKLEEARDILFDAIASGDFSKLTIPDDELVDVCWRYFLARQKGARTLNLKILAGILAEGVRSEGFTSEGFDEAAGRLESLSKNELIVIATMLAADMSLEPVEGDQGDARATKIWRKTIDILVPSCFGDHTELFSYASSASRSGLIVPGLIFVGSLGYSLSSSAVGMGKHVLSEVQSST